MSASVANGSTVFLPLWSNVELKRLSITSAIGKGMPRRSLPHSSWFMNPPPTAFNSAIRSRTIRYRASDWLNFSSPPGWLRSSRLPTCWSIQPRRPAASFLS